MSFQLTMRLLYTIKCRELLIRLSVTGILIHCSRHYRSILCEKWYFTLWELYLIILNCTKISNINYLLHCSEQVWILTSTLVISNKNHAFVYKQDIERNQLWIPSSALSKGWLFLEPGTVWAQGLFTDCFSCSYIFLILKRIPFTESLWCLWFSSICAPLDLMHHYPSHPVQWVTFIPMLRQSNWKIHHGIM